MHFPIVFHTELPWDVLCFNLELVSYGPGRALNAHVVFRNQNQNWNNWSFCNFFFKKWTCFWSLHPVSNDSWRGATIGHIGLQSNELKMEVQVRIQLTDRHKAQNLSQHLEEHQRYKMKSASSSHNRCKAEGSPTPSSPQHQLDCNGEISDIQSETREKGELCITFTSFTAEGENNWKPC